MKEKGQRMADKKIGNGTASVMWDCGSSSSFILPPSSLLNQPPVRGEGPVHKHAAAHDIALGQRFFFLIEVGDKGVLKAQDVKKI